ncbi:MAG: hypothetical protein PVF50_03700, partial [Gammaproteobacteria bacterium]
LYNDVTLSIGTLLWADRIFVGLDFETFAKSSFDRLQQHIGNIEQTLVDWQWLKEMNSRPIMLADCILWECLDLCRTVFGLNFDFDSVPVLAGIHARYATGTAFSELLAQTPCPITARDGEHDVIERIQALLAS